MTGTVTTYSRPNKLQTFGYVAIGSLVAVLGTVGLLMQLLSPLSLLGSVNYMTVGSLLAVSHSSELQRTLYNMLPAPLKRFLFERSLLQLFEDRSRYLQITAYFVACLTLPEDQVAKLRADLPATFDHCRQHGVIGSCLPTLFNSNDRNAPHHNTALVPNVQEVNRNPTQDPFLKKVARAALDSACGDAFRAAGELCTQGAAGAGRRLLRLAHGNWVPTTACVLGSSTLCFWLLDLLGRGVSYEKLLLTSARYLMRSCSGYMKIVYALQRDSARALGALTWDRSSVVTALAVAGSAVTAVSAGGWMLCGERSGGVFALSCASDSAPRHSQRAIEIAPTSVKPHPGKITSRACEGAQGLCDVHERKACAVLVILAIVEMSALFRPIHSLVISLRKFHPRRFLGVAGTDMPATSARSNDVQVTINEERCAMVYKLCQVLMVVYAHRMRCSVKQASWLQSVLYTQVSKRLVTPRPGEI